MSTPTDRPTAFTDAAETWNRRYADEDFVGVEKFNPSLPEPIRVL